MDTLDANIMDKSMRSVFVGNIPYEATEEKLKDIFGEVGQVLSFKLVFDRETGKPKGYGFCEYRDQETALSAMRNLNGYEIGGRNLRVDNACTEKSRMEMQNLMNQPPVENPYGDPTSADKAPEAISKAVASLPPEQMFELMKQMKLCTQNNPTEARNMLLQNPQLAYALLQAQVVMRIIDPQIAAAMLHPQNSVPILHVSEKTLGIQMPSNTFVPPVQVAARQDFVVNTPSFVPPPTITQDIDLRGMDPRLRAANDDPRSTLPNPLPPAVAESFSRDPRSNYDPRQAAGGRVDPRQQKSGTPTVQQSMQPGARQTPAIVPPPVQQPVPTPQLIAARAGISSNLGASGASDQEKAALIMQVLQLSDDQIAMLPPEQRNSILVLKEQIAKSTQR